MDYIKDFNNALKNERYKDCNNALVSYIRQITDCKYLRKCCTQFKKHGTLIKNLDISLFFDGNIYRKDCIEAFKNSKTFKECITNYKHVYDSYIKKKPQKNLKWFENYYNLYYDILNNGFKINMNDNPITLIKFHNTYIRLDGTHRSSCLFHIVKQKNINYYVNVIDFFHLINDNRYNSIKKKYNMFLEKTLFSHSNYQRIDNTLINSKINYRYLNLSKKIKKYLNNNIVLDIGANDGYNTLILQKNSNAKEIYGIEYREYNCKKSNFLKYFWNLNVCNNNNLHFKYGNADSQIDLLKKCNVIIFLRSIYHCGDSIIKILNNLSKNTYIIVECNKAHSYKLSDPEKIVPIPGKRLTLKHNLKAFFDNRGYQFVEEFVNSDDVLIYKT